MNTRLALARFVLLVAAASVGCASDPKPGTTGGRGGSGTGGSAGSGGGGTGGPPPMFGTPAGKVEDGPFECTATAPAGAITFEKIAPWRDDAAAAYTIIHDDACGPELRGIDKVAVPALDMRNLKANLGPFVQVCEEAQLWDMVKDMQSRGHEIINHSYTHPNIRMENAGKEVMMAKMVFDMKLAKPVTFFIFPFDDFSPATIQLVEMAGHIGARAGSRDDNDGFDKPPINTADLGMNDMQLEFDAWPRAYSKYTSFRENEILNLHVHNAIEKNAFAVREFHSVTTRDGVVSNEGFGPVPLRLYEEHLDFLFKAWKANKVWTSTASTIIRYRRAHKACTAEVTDTAITFNTGSADCTKYATPLSVIVNTAMDVPGLKAVQGGKAVPVRKLAARKFSVTADPTAGSVEIGGCMNIPPTVDGVQPLPAKPAPVATVCELEQVKGSGMPGNMDNLERNPAQLQILPNPQQADGRTGSWSWYPQTVSVGIVNEGMNRVLKYSGMVKGNWTGATLAFLGGNGAGSCYDASAYKGIRFKIKGTVNAPQDALLNGKVAVSLISAETQTQKYGGDLKGEGGHFNFFAPITAEWQTVELPWERLNRPTWGPTAALSMLAKTKLQAIDFGVSNLADNFEIFIDDVELF